MAEGQSTSSTRWNPTSEQIALLEATYSQGMRTPKPDQIEQIASRLRMYGNIEGKSVFYWFQNRKARERQRQKQQRVASINQFLQPPSLAGTSHTNTLLQEVLSTEQKSAAVMQKIHVTTDDNQTANPDNLCEPPTLLDLFPVHSAGLAEHRSELSIPLELQRSVGNNKMNENIYEPRIPELLELFPLHPNGMARENLQSVPESRNDSRSDEYIDEQNDARSGGGLFQNFFHFITRHPGK